MVLENLGQSRPARLWNVQKNEGFVSVGDRVQVSSAFAVCTDSIRALLACGREDNWTLRLRGFNIKDDRVRFDLQFSLVVANCGRRDNAAFAAGEDGCAIHA